MNKKIHLSKKIILFKNKKKNILVLVFVIICIFLVFIFKFINKKVFPVVLNYAELEARKLATLVVNKTVSNNISNKINIDEIFLINKNSNGEISTIDFNPSIVNSILTETTSTIQKELQKIENGDIEDIENFNLDYISNNNKLMKGIIFEIPSGLVFENVFFANLGPKIPVKLNLVGDITSEIKTQVTNYGINNALIEIRIDIKLIEQVILPVITDKIEITTSIPIALKLIQGTVPNYYLNGISNSSNSLSIPTQQLVNYSKIKYNNIGWWYNEEKNLYI